MNQTIALAGNPNSGKTTLFNELTGARQHVGNYPGVTVEKKQGVYSSDDTQLNVVDLPGTYSLTAFSLDEIVARDFLVQEKPASVVNIIDASNLERNLYLTIQFLEMGLPVSIALNMMDVAKGRGMDINTKKRSQLLGVSVVPTIVEELTNHLRTTLGTYPEVIIADHRYGFISSVLKQGVIKRQYDYNRLELSDKN